MVANYKQVVVDLEAGRPQEHNEFEFRVSSLPSSLPRFLPPTFLPLLRSGYPRTAARSNGVSAS